MTISVSNNTPRVSYTVSEGATQTSFTVNFEFFADADLRVFVDNTLKTITTHYTVSGGNGSTGTVTMSVTGASGGSTVVIVRAIALERTTDFPTSGAFNISSLNTELDRIIAIHADVDDTAERGLRLQESDDAVSTELPLKDTRKGTVLAFNASTGVPEAGPSISSVTTVATQSANINTVAGISANVTTVAGIAANVTTVAGISSNVTTVAGVSSNVTTVAGIQANVTTVAGIASDVTAVAGISSDVAAVENIKADVSTVAGIASNVTTVAGISSNVTSVANIASNVTTVAGINTTHLSNVSGVASNVALLGTSDAVSDLNTLAAISGDITSLANSLEKTYTVTVANPGSGNVFVLDSSNAPAIEMFRGNTYIFNQNDGTNDGHPLVFKNGSSAYEVGVTYFLNGSATTQSNYVNTTTFNAGASSGDRKIQIEVATTAPSSGLRYYCYIHGNGMGNTITVKDSNISLVAGSIANVNSVGGALTNVNTVAGSISNINTVAGANSNITTVAGANSNITAVAGAITNVNNVGGAISAVNTVASNISGVNSFADRYRIASSAPTSSLDVGDLYFDTTANELKVYKSSGWAAAGSTVNGTSARFTYNISGTPTSVTGSDANGNTLAYDAGFVDVYLNGVKQVNGTDVTVTSGDTVTFASALANGDVVDIVGFGTFNVAAISASNINSGTLPNARLSSVPNSALANSSITINGSAIALGGSVTVETDFTWETKTSAFNVSASRGYFVDTSSGAVTATLPASPTAGDTVRFIDLSATFDTANLTVARNGKKIQGDASDMTVATERAGFALVFSGDTQGWLLMEK
tara:strand:- start:2073 stop:4523 length:2451 start_codon:yes stop_codon:yes gene_type:complete